jgi:hypothetical protein
MRQGAGGRGQGGGGGGGGAPPPGGMEEVPAASSSQSPRFSLRLPLQFHEVTTTCCCHRNWNEKKRGMLMNIRMDIENFLRIVSSLVAARDIFRVAMNQS